MQQHEELIKRFYEAFGRKDHKTMQECYHADATFSDPAFPGLSSAEVKAMWEMLLTSGTDLKIEFRDVTASGNQGSAHWEAWYAFSATGRRVHNIIDASFEFKDEKIYRHQDKFNFWRWSKQALGTPGLMLGWTPLLKNKVQKTAKARLQKFMEKKKSA